MLFRFFKQEALAVDLFSFLLSKEISSGPECSILDFSYLVQLIYWFCCFFHYRFSGFCVHSLSLSVSDYLEEISLPTSQYFSPLYALI